MPQLPPGVKYRHKNEMHICIELADQQHICSVYLSTHMVHMRVVHDHSCKTVVEMHLDKRKCANWEDILEGFQEKAIKHFPAPIRHRSIPNSVIRRGW